MATAKPAKKKGAVAAARKKQPPWLWIGVVGLVAILAVAALVSSGGSDDGDKTTAAQETAKVTTTGEKLPELPREGGDDPAVGKVIPEATGSGFDGAPVAIKNDGRAKLILFVAHWCPHCQKEVPLLADYLKSHKLPASVDLVTVSTGVDKARPNYPPSAWLAKEKWTAPVIADDGTAADAYGLSAFPYFIAVDGSGKVVARTTGEISTDDFAALAERAAGTQ